MEINIGNKKLKTGGEPFIVAEVGINHNGELSKALEMVDVAKEAGVDAVKFQTFKAKEFVGDPEQLFTYYSQGKKVTESMLAMFSRYELERNDWLKIKEKCVKEDILFLSTPQNFSDLELLLEIGISAIKVGSDDFTNTPLLKEYASTGLPLIISSGMADLSEVFGALEAVGYSSGYPTILLICTSQYPTPMKDVNLLKLQTLRKIFPDLALGFSDHTQGFLASSLAVAFGACFFEKHFTLDKNLPGPDHWFSEDPSGLREWAKSIRSSYELLGDAQVKPTEKELEMRILARRSVVAIREINKGEVFSHDNVGLRRPGNGLSPDQIEKIFGLISTRNIEKGTLIKFGDFANGQG